MFFAIMITSEKTKHETNIPPPSKEPRATSNPSSPCPSEAMMLDKTSFAPFPKASIVTPARFCDNFNLSDIFVKA